MSECIINANDMESLGFTCTQALNQTSRWERGQIRVALTACSIKVTWAGLRCPIIEWNHACAPKSAYTTLDELHALLLGLRQFDKVPAVHLSFDDLILAGFDHVGTMHHMTRWQLEDLIIQHTEKSISIRWEGASCAMFTTDHYDATMLFNLLKGLRLPRHA